MEILYGTWKCTPKLPKEKHLQTTTLVSRRIFSPAFFSGDSEGESKKEVGATYHSASLGHLNSCNLFLKWMNKWVIFCHVDSGNLPTNDWERGGVRVSNLGMFDLFKPYHSWADISFLQDEGCTFLVLHVMGFTRMVMNGLLLLIVFQVGGMWDVYKHIYIYICTIINNI